MFNNEQIKVLKNCLDYVHGKNLVAIQDYGNSKIPNLIETVNDAKNENDEKSNAKIASGIGYA
jgi:hypothetical protein